MMKYLSIILTCLLIAFSTAVASAQSQDMMRQAIEGYKNLTSMTSKVTKRVHNEMVTKDVVTTGTFYFKKPAKMCISTNAGKDMLLTDGETFTIVQDGKATTASGKGNSSLTPLVNAIKGITSGKESTDISDVADVDMDREGNNMVMTVVPITKNAAEKRKLVYQSFVITVDTQAGELRSIRLNGKGKNYEEYTFTDYKPNVAIDDTVFKAK